jgi:hypothetical protein
MRGALKKAGEDFRFVGCGVRAAFLYRSRIFLFRDTQALKENALGQQESMMNRQCMGQPLNEFTICHE